MPSYWDPTHALGQLLATPPNDHAGAWTHSGRHHHAAIFRGSWVARDWRNVPGAFYAAGTDTCGGGRALAPELVLVNEEWTEFVYRQPADEAQLVRLLDAAYDDPAAAYACDGNDHWTPTAVRRWWTERNRLLESIASAIEVLQSADALPEVRSLNAYSADVRGPLEEQMNRYARFLEQ